MAAAAMLLAGGHAVSARDLATDAPYPAAAPDAPAKPATKPHPEKVRPKPHPTANASTVPLPQPAPRSPVEEAAKTAPVPLPKPPPKVAPKPLPKAAVAAPQLAALPSEKPGTRPAPAAAEPATEVFAGIPAGERLKIQASLLWAGDVSAATGAEDPMRAAIKNFQKRIKTRVTGVLTAEERARLVAAANDHEESFGWTVVTDPATGVRIGLPGKLAPQAHDAAHGTRWSSKYGEVQVETFRLKRADLKLDAVFEAMKREPAGRRIDYSTLRDDGFVISGMQGLKYFTVRAKMRDGEVRGFTMSYDQAMEGIVAPVTVAMASAFTPFPERAAPFAAPAKAVDYGSGIVVSERGHIVTAARLTEGCQVLLASGLGTAERIAEDRAQGLALLRIYGRHDLRPVALAGHAQAGEATLIGIPDPRAQNGRDAPTEVKARLAGSGSIELRQPAPMAGLAGAAAVDAQGHFAGIAELRSTQVASTEPVFAPVRLVGAAAIRDFLAAHNVTSAAASGDARAAVVRIICVRK